MSHPPDPRMAMTDIIRERPTDKAPSSPDSGSDGARHVSLEGAGIPELGGGGQPLRRPFSWYPPAGPPGVRPLFPSDVTQLGNHTLNPIFSRVR